MRKPFRIPFVLASVLLAFCFGGVSLLPAADNPGAAPRAVIQNVVHQALAILRDPKLSPEEKREKIKQLAYDNINFEVMSRLSLGRYWRDLTDAQRAQYAAAFKEHVTNTYRHTTDQYNDEDVAVTGDRLEQDGDWTVQTRITGGKDHPGQEVAKVEYRLRGKDNQWKVIDFTVDGVSLVSNFRSQFQSIMENGGIDKLLQLLHEKNAANEK